LGISRSLAGAGLFGFTLNTILILLRTVLKRIQELLL
uniref:Uncharacterized protein n=1 Tax=Parascaris equorum TaxID=6256 RepID=A0A914R4R0_PAREQ